MGLDRIHQMFECGGQPACQLFFRTDSRQFDHAVEVGPEQLFRVAAGFHGCLTHTDNQFEKEALYQVQPVAGVMVNGHQHAVQDLTGLAAIAGADRREQGGFLAEVELADAGVTLALEGVDGVGTLLLVAIFPASQGQRRGICQVFSFGEMAEFDAGAANVQRHDIVSRREHLFFRHAGDQTADNPLIAHQRHRPDESAARAETHRRLAPAKGLLDRLGAHPVARLAAGGRAV